jgi:hypothetical protein
MPVRAVATALLTAAAVTLTAVASAQTPSATVVGRIVDASDAVVSQATIRVRNVNERRAHRRFTGGWGLHGFQSGAGHL